jgi:hypothetical protein
MSGLISNRRAGADQQLPIGNGPTAALLSVLLVSGAELAVSNWEQELLAWLGEHDQSVFGSGVVSFDLDEIAWDRERFGEQQGFLLAMIDLALVRFRWERLVEHPAQMSDALRRLRRLVEGFGPSSWGRGDPGSGRLTGPSPSVSPVRRGGARPARPRRLQSGSRLRLGQNPSGAGRPATRPTRSRQSGAARLPPIGYPPAWAPATPRRSGQPAAGSVSYSVGSGRPAWAKARRRL